MLKKLPLGNGRKMIINPNIDNIFSSLIEEFLKFLINIIERIIIKKIKPTKPISDKI